MLLEVLNLLWVLTLISSSNGSIVIDSRDQRGIYLSEYCPKMPYCAEGAHVMCMFYNPNSIMGPRCSQPRNVTITPALAHMLLDVLNAVRSKAAQGKEKGKNGQNLPKAYGMFRLKWDNELATFAQVLANQCVLRHDLCRASRRFPDPGQTAGLVRFTMPDWNPVSQNAHFNKIGLTFSKLHYATTQSLKSWYSHKDFVTSDMIRSYPDWSAHPDKLQGRLYLEMIHSATTHLGCGISAYSEYAYHNNRAELNYNSVQLICNYSARPKKGMAVYSTKPPTEPGMTIRCGCPEGYEEDIDCLCIESNSVPVPTKSCTSKNCKPAIVLLPIFTVEDAPVLKIGNNAEQNFHMMGDINEMFNRSTMADKSNDDIFSAFEEKENEYDNEKPTPYHKIFPSLQAQTYNDINAVIQNKPNASRGQPFSRKFQKVQYKPNYRIPNPMSPPRIKSQTRILPSVQHRYFNKDSFRTPNFMYKKKSLQASPSHVLTNRKITQPKSSIFSRVHQFELPSLGRKDGISFVRLANEIRRDVAPRKDFSNAQKLLNAYLNNKRHLEGTDTRKFLLVHEYLPTTIPTNYVNNSANLNRFIKNKFHYPDFNTSTGLTKRYDINNEESDKKLMALLDNLEQEVKHIDLDVNEKEIFDAKIRKIYGTVVGKPVDLYKTITRKSNVEENARNMIDKRVYETEDKVKELHSKMYADQKFTRPLQRSQNMLVPYEKDKRHMSKLKNLRNTIDSDGQRTRFIEESDREGKYNDEILKSRAVYKNEDKVSFDEIRKTHRPTEEDNSRNYRSEYRPSAYDEAKNKHSKDINNEDPIGLDRRRYYQEKLDNIERKIFGNRNSYRRHSDHEKERALRLVRPSRDDLPVRPRTKTQINPVYIGDRARFLHGF